MWGGGDVGKCDSFIACSLWTLCFCAGFAAFLHFVTFIFMSENESFLLVSGFEIESLLCWFVCKWHLMTFDAFMMWKIVNSWWKTSFFSLSLLHVCQISASSEQTPEPDALLPDCAESLIMLKSEAPSVPSLPPDRHQQTTAPHKATA